MTHRYYSLDKYIDADCYPKYRRNKPLDVVNFDKKKLVNVSYNLWAWGYVDFADPIRVEDIKKFGLVKAPKMDYGRPLPLPGEIWRHFKGYEYKIQFLCQHTEDKSILVTYFRLPARKTTRFFARPLDVFMSEVDHSKYPNAQQKYRFEKVREVSF